MPAGTNLPVRQLVSKILGKVVYPDRDNWGSPDCAICHGTMYIEEHGEPYPICNACAQDAARRLALAHRARRTA